MGIAGETTSKGKEETGEGEKGNRSSSSSLSVRKVVVKRTFPGKVLDLCHGSICHPTLVPESFHHEANSDKH